MHNRQRSTIKLTKRPRAVSIVYKEIVQISAALKTANLKYTVGSVVTLGNYADSAQERLSNIVHQGGEEDEHHETEQDEEDEEGEGEEVEGEEEDEKGEEVNEEGSVSLINRWFIRKVF
jgi:hypothetical protein